MLRIYLLVVRLRSSLFFVIVKCFNSYYVFLVKLEGKMNEKRNDWKLLIVIWVCVLSLVVIENERFLLKVLLCVCIYNFFEGVVYWFVSMLVINEILGDDFVCNIFWLRMFGVYGWCYFESVDGSVF